MAYWKTKSNSFTVNINERLIRAMKNKGARFCKMSDNSDIDNENSSWWMDVATEKNDENQSEETDENQSEETDENQSEETHRILKPNITVKTVDGDSVTGYITHWVRGPCSGTDEKNWFIIQPGQYPTSYTYNNEMIVEDM
jgi:hypothetical protein